MVVNRFKGCELPNTVLVQLDADRLSDLDSRSVGKESALKLLHASQRLRAGLVLGLLTKSGEGISFTLRNCLLHSMRVLAIGDRSISKVSEYEFDLQNNAQIKITSLASETKYNPICRSSATTFLFKSLAGQ